jgi:hypothetical protein
MQLTADQNRPLEFSRNASLVHFIEDRSIGTTAFHKVAPSAGDRIAPSPAAQNFVLVEHARNVGNRKIRVRGDELYYTNSRRR